MPGEPLVVGLGAYHVANPIAVATDGRPGRQSSLDLADRVLLAATYWRTNLTMRQVGPPFGVSHSTAHRVIDTG